MRVLIKVYFPYRFVWKINVNLAMPVGRLRSLMHLGTDQLVFSGQILPDIGTLSGYGVKEGDTLVVVSNVPHDREMERWLVITNDADAFHDRMQFIVNEQTAQEAARIHDVLMAKIERKPKMFRRICSQLDTRRPKPSPQTSQATVMYDKPDQPSCLPLPVQWAVPAAPQAECEAQEDALVAERDPIEPAVKPNC